MRIPLVPATTALFGLILAAGLSTSPAHAISLGEMADAAAADLELLPTFISIAFYVLGIAIAGFGLLRLKRHVEQPAQTTLSSGLIALLIGAALIATPSVINAVAETFAVDGATITRPALDP